MESPEPIDPLTAAHEATALWHRQQAASQQDCAARTWHSDQAEHWTAVADRRREIAERAARRRRDGTELGRLAEDMVFEVLEASQIKEVLSLGATSRRLRTLTTADRVWAPRVATELSFGSSLAASTVASLASFGCDPRRLCLQFLPWQRAWPPAEFRSTHGDGEVFAWRPRDEVPASLRLPFAQEWVFCEVYERDNSGNYNAFASKVVRLADCGPWANNPRTLIVPLDLDTAGHHNQEPWYEVRVFALVDGVVVPICDTDAMDGELGERYVYLNSRPPVSDRADIHEMILQLKVGFNTTEDHQPHTYEFNSLHIALREYENDSDSESVEDPARARYEAHYVVDGLRRFLSSDAISAQRTAFFVKDYRRSDSDYVDGNWKRPKPWADAVLSPEPGTGGIMLKFKDDVEDESPLFTRRFVETDTVGALFKYVEAEFQYGPDNGFGLVCGSLGSIRAIAADAVPSLLATPLKDAGVHGLYDGQAVTVLPDNSDYFIPD